MAGATEKARASQGLSGQEFVGRDPELAELLGGLEDAIGGRGRLFLLSGEPGIGKSRLADELGTAARDRGAHVLWGRCWEAGGAPAYWPWVQLIRASLRDVDPDRAREQLGEGAAEIAQMLPELRETYPDLPEPAALDPEAARFRLFDSVARFLRTVAAEQPLVVVLDDLHAADTPSLLLLEFLGADLSDARTLVVAAYRDVDPTVDERLASTLGRLGRLTATSRLPLGGLSQSEVSRLVQSSMGSASAGLVESIARRTEGNPLFVGEMLRLLQAEGAAAIDIDRLGLPSGITGVIARRIAGLSSSCREVLATASVLGREFGLDVLERLADEPADALVALLDEAQAARAIVSTPKHGPRRDRFAHALIRETLYESLPSDRRLSLHRRAAEAIEALADGDLGHRVAEIAHHHAAADPAGRSPEAARFARLAGERAVELLAYEEAIRLFQDALERHDARGDDAVGRCELLLALGDAQARAGEGDASKQTFMAAADLSRGLGRPALLARAALGYGGRFVWARPAGDAALVPLLQDALATVGDDLPELRVGLLSRLSGALRDDSAREPRWTLAAEAVEIASRLGDPALLSYAIEARYAAIWEPSTLEERLILSSEMIRHAEASGELERVVQARGYRVHALIELGDLRGARAAIAREGSLARDLGQPAWLWLVASGEICLLLAEGRLDEAEEAIEQTLRSGRDAQEADARVAHVLQTYLLRRERGGLEELEEPLLRATEEFAWYPMFRCVLAELHAELGREEAARQALDALAPGDFGFLPVDSQWLFALSFLPRVCAVAGDEERATTLYELMLPYEERTAYSPPEASTGYVARSLGVLARIKGELDAAVAHLERSVQLGERSGARAWVARDTQELGEALLARDEPGDRERARELLASARTATQEMGMTVLEARIAAALGEREDAEAMPAGASLFRREGEYWSIAFEGDAFRLRDTKGLRYLGHLLGRPGAEVHVLDLVSVAEGAVAQDGRSRARSGAEDLTVGSGGDAGEILDPEARRAYRRRLEELQSELEEAESWGDAERASRVREEMEFLAGELTGAEGLGGRPRRVASAAERARQSVTKAVRLAVDRIANQSKPLGRHLRATVKTGTFCSYSPDPRTPITWRS